MRRTRRTGAVWILVLLVVSGFAARTRASDTTEGLRFIDLDGKTYDSETLKSNPVVVNIGGHW